MSGLLGQRAVVVGAGIGGLAMAGALAKYFDRVEIFERDSLVTSPASRSGTPQDRHPHGLLAGGLRALGCRCTAKARFRLVTALCIEATDRAGIAPSGRGDREYCVAAEMPGNR